MGMANSGPPWAGGGDVGGAAEFATPEVTGALLDEGSVFTAVAVPPMSSTANRPAAFVPLRQLRKRISFQRMNLASRV